MTVPDSIAERGVKTPISVHPDPVWPGKYIVNHGARRLRASRLAGRLTIPAFVDEQYNAYNQVIENLQRENLTPMELAMFIQKRIEAGDKKVDIARQLGKDAATITHHLALIGAPAVVEDAMAAGITSPKTLYSLRGMHEKYPEQVDSWVASGAEITRASIEKLGHDQGIQASAATGGEKILGHDQENDVKKISLKVKNLGHDQGKKAVKTPVKFVMANQVPAPEVLTVMHNGRRATVASNSTLILVYENADLGCDGETAEVQLGEVEVVGVVKI